LVRFLLSAAVALVLLGGSPAVAVDDIRDGRTTVIVEQDTTTIGPCHTVDFDATNFGATESSGKCPVDVSSNVTQLGPKVGETPNEFATTCNLTGITWDMGGGTCLLPEGTGSGPTTSGSLRLNTTYEELEVGDGAATQIFVPGRFPLKIGGDGSDGAFTYAGEGTGGCSGSQCKGGECSGTSPNGTCTLTLNSRLYAATGTNPRDVSVVGQHTTITVTAGTITLAAPAYSTVWGQGLVWLATGDVSITGGTIDLEGLGATGVAGGTCVTSASAGKAGQSTLYAAGGAGGGSGSNPGVAGEDAEANDPGLERLLAPWLVGAGGGAAPVSGQIVAYQLNHTPWAPAVSGGGGGGAGCAANCTGSVTCGDGGKGGGHLSIESGGTFTCTSATIEMDGDAGTNGSGGGAGGGMVVTARAIGTNTCTKNNNGGAGGAAPSCPSSECGAGAAGGDGMNIFRVAPY
jgi:hypothetical protein